MAPAKALPLSPGFADEEAYVESLLKFITSGRLFQQLCGGVHILDFLTKEPDLYSTLLPGDWKDCFKVHGISDILDLLMREDLSQFGIELDSCTPPKQCDAIFMNAESGGRWRNGPSPPLSLLQYIQDVRKHTLDRHVRSADRGSGPDYAQTKLARQVTVGMKPKKIHEVAHFVKYIDELTMHINYCTKHKISHMVDFGSGQNYLGRTLASYPYCKDVIAIENKPHNISEAKTMDVFAKLAEKKLVMRNKKEFRLAKESSLHEVPNRNTIIAATESISVREFNKAPAKKPTDPKGGGVHGTLQYLEANIRDGDLSTIISHMHTPNVDSEGTADPQLIIISLHSCGNLLHHGLRSLVSNPSVKAVAMVGCCYNLMTERLGPSAYKLPSLRHPSERLNSTSKACDPLGFPMSERLATYKHRYGEGIRLNITARMMAVQAPKNWTSKDSEDFFTRHFYRALLQRILVDKGVLSKPTFDANCDNARSPRSWSGPEQAVILGSLRKSCYSSFVAYVRGALAKLRDDLAYGDKIKGLEDRLTDEDIVKYEGAYIDKKKQLSIVWSLMAFSAGVVESAIVVDRWLYLQEQEEVKESWVEAIFDYKQSPRNLVVAGIKG